MGVLIDIIMKVSLFFMEATKHLPLKTRRHDLDALRAFAMILGIVLHGVLSFMPRTFWPAQDVNAHPIYGIVLVAIHGFRMPLFFLLSGFFTAMLWRNRGLRELGKHRAKRILLPMVLGVIVFVPMINNVGKLSELKKANTIWGAAQKGDINSIRQHLAEGVDINGKDDKQATPLHWSAVYGQTDATEFLIEQGADVNGKDGAGSSPLHWAAFLGQPETVQLLIEKGADVDARNDNGDTPLDSTKADRGTTQFIAGLLEIDINIEQVITDRPRIAAMLGGENPKFEERNESIWGAAQKGDINSIRQHLAEGVDINGKDDKQATPLHWSAVYGQTDATEFLIEQGADVNGKDGAGSSPLHWAAFLGQPETVQLLIEKGADVDARNDNGDTPLDSTKADRGTTQFIAGLLEIDINIEQVITDRPRIAAMLGGDNGESRLMSPLTQFIGKIYYTNVFGRSIFTFHHLWFLYYLILLTIGFAFLTFIVEGFPWKIFPSWLFSAPYCWFWLVPLTLLPQYHMSTFGADTSAGVKISWWILLYYGIFFSSGAISFGQKSFEQRNKRLEGHTLWPICFVVAIPILFLSLSWLEKRGTGSGTYHHLITASAVIYAWLMIFGFVGLFSQFLSRENRIIRYISDSAYWLYLSHLPVIMAVQIWVSDWPYPSALKFIFVCVSTTGLLLIIYQCAIRYTWVGTMLNGKRTRGKDQSSTVPTAV